MTPGEVIRVEDEYSSPDADGVRIFEGDLRDRDEIKGFLGEAEMIAFMLERGVPVDSVVEDAREASALKAAVGDTMTIEVRSIAARRSNRVPMPMASADSKGIFGTVMRARAFWERPR